METQRHRGTEDTERKREKERGKERFGTASEA
jgi:hypothetical protein